MDALAARLHILNPAHSHEKIARKLVDGVALWFIEEFSLPRRAIVGPMVSFAHPEPILPADALRARLSAVLDAMGV